MVVVKDYLSGFFNGLIELLFKDKAMEIKAILNSDSVIFRSTKDVQEELLIVLWLDIHI